MPRSSATGAGLQARNVARNRAEVAAVALGLFASRGFDVVTIDDIAEAAGMSRRTFFRYFESKEDAVLPYEQDLLEQFRQLLADRPPDEPILATIRRAAVALVEASTNLDRDDTRARLRLIRETPSVHARSLELRSRWELEVRAIVAEHLGVEAETSLTATVVATAAVGAARAATDVWTATDCTGDLADLVADAFDLLAAGLTTL